MSDFLKIVIPNMNEIIRKIVDPPPALLQLFDAIQNGTLEGVISVLDKYKPDINLNTKKGTTIALACRKGNIEIVCTQKHSI